MGMRCNLNLANKIQSGYWKTKRLVQRTADSGVCAAEQSCDWTRGGLAIGACRSCDTAQEGFDLEEGRGTQRLPLDDELGEPGLHLEQKIKGW
jgi:hypothetical protein